jgi:hypothetical protein
LKGYLPEFPYECSVEFDHYKLKNDDFDNLKYHFGDSISWTGPKSVIRRDCDLCDGECYDNKYTIYSGTFKTLN